MTSNLYVTSLEVGTQITITPWCSEHDTPIEGYVRFSSNSTRPGQPRHFDDGDLRCLGTGSPHRFECRSKWFLKIDLPGG